MIHQFQAWVVACLFFVAMLACWGLGWRSGRLRPPDSGDDPALKFTDASLAILGLLLAFTFAMALGRHDHRRLMVVGESNAIGDFYTCASIVKDPHRSALQSVIRSYTTNEMRALSRFLPDSEQRELTRESLEMQNRMIGLVAGAVAEGTPIAVSLTNTLNELTSANASRLAAYEEVLPWSIQLLLLLAACTPSFLTGRMQGASGKVHFSGTLNFVVLVTLVIYVTMDLNQGRRGLIRVNVAPFERLVQSMGGTPIPSPAVASESPK
jgi:hypothetical protein